VPHNNYYAQTVLPTYQRLSVVTWSPVTVLEIISAEWIWPTWDEQNGITFETAAVAYRHLSSPVSFTVSLCSSLSRSLYLAHLCPIHSLLRSAPVSVSMSLCLSVCLFLCLSVCLCLYVSLIHHLSYSLSLSKSLSVSVLIAVPVLVSVHVSAFVSDLVSVSICVSISENISLHVCIGLHICGSKYTRLPQSRYQFKYCSVFSLLCLHVGLFSVSVSVYLFLSLSVPYYRPHPSPLTPSPRKP